MGQLVLGLPAAAPLGEAHQAARADRGELARQAGLELERRGGEGARFRRAARR